MKALYLHLHRYLSSISPSILQINSRIKIILESFYKDFDFSKCEVGPYYSLALYQCLCDFDICCSNEYENLSHLNELLGKYSSIFPNNYVFDILLVFTNLKLGKFSSSKKFHDFLGCFYRAHKIFKTLQIKCLQLDTLGYIVYDHALNFVALSECELFCNELSSLYDSNRHETWALMCQSLENRSFVSTLDFFEFYNRLERSIQHISAETNYIKLNILKLPLKDLIQNFSSERIAKSLRVLSYSFGQYNDNRDFKIFDTIDVTGNLKTSIKSLCGFTVIITFLEKKIIFLLD